MYHDRVVFIEVETKMKLSIQQCRYTTDKNAINVSSCAKGLQKRTFQPIHQYLGFLECPFSPTSSVYHIKMESSHFLQC